MPVWVSLLRGVNLGKHNQINMPELREALAAAGFQDVRSYVQSGNLVTTSSHRSADRVATAVADVIAARFGLQLPVVVRSPAQLRQVLTWCPFPGAAARPTTVHVIHLAAVPDPGRLPSVLDQDWGPDQVAHRGLEIVIRYDGAMHASRLQHALVLRRLGGDGTARNWRTLQALVDLTATG